MAKPKIVVFASGTASGGGSGFENLVQHSRGGDLNAEIVAVASNYENGGVRDRAARLSVPFVFFPPDEWTKEGQPRWSAKSYRRIVVQSGAEWVALSGWLKHVRGLDPIRTFNIHPALLSQCKGRFGGLGMYGHHVHAAVAKALACGEITGSGVTMHFVTSKYDRGPAFFELAVSLPSNATPDEIAHAVNTAEHKWQPRITNLVVHRKIRWDGKRRGSLVVPSKYTHLPGPQRS